MVVYMTHPRHGTHIAYSDAEGETCKKNGWSLREDSKENAKEEPKREILMLKKVKNDNGD